MNSDYRPSSISDLRYRLQIAKEIIGARVVESIEKQTAILKLEEARDWLSRCSLIDEDSND